MSDEILDRIKRRITELRQRIVTDSESLEFLVDLLDENERETVIDDAILSYVATNAGRCVMSTVCAAVNQMGVRGRLKKLIASGKIVRLGNSSCLWPADYEQPEPEPEESDDDDDFDEHVDYQPSGSGIAMSVRGWLKDHPDSTLDEIRDGIIHKICTHSPDPRGAIGQSVAQQVGAGRLLRSASRTYRLAPELPKHWNGRPKLDIENRVSTCSLIRKFIRENPGLRNYEVAAQLASEINTTSPHPERVVRSTISQLCFMQRVVRRTDDETYWLPEQEDLMNATPLRESDAETDHLPPVRIDDASWHLMKLNLQIGEKLNG